jgi:hypothetical protein
MPLLIAFGFGILPAPGTALAAGDIILNELLADPASDWTGDGEVDFKDDEWIEIANRGSSAADLADYWISDAVDDPTLRFRFSGSLAPGAVLLVTGATAAAWQEANGAGSGGLSLSNTGGELALWRDRNDQTDLVDSVIYLGYQVQDDRALGRYPLESETWILFDALNLYHGNQVPGSTGCEPSPGQRNQCEGAPAQTSAWGSLKQLYTSPDA